MRLLCLHAWQIEPSGQRGNSSLPDPVLPPPPNVSAPQAFGVAHNVLADNIPFLCADLVYTYELLISGFGLGATQKMEVASLIDSIDTNWDPAETTWALGMVVDYLYNAPRPIAGGK